MNQTTKLQRQVIEWTCRHRHCGDHCTVPIIPGQPPENYAPAIEKQHERRNPICHGVHGVSRVYVERPGGNGVSVSCTTELVASLVRAATEVT